jgi:hypothetical protein
MGAPKIVASTKTCNACVGMEDQMSHAVNSAHASVSVPDQVSHAVKSFELAYEEV